ncbi:MAG TPA: NfeD family protein [Polyangiaceae bacterium]|nr:NfeD family protein [Polyangiaceae bacterium]
MGIVFLAALILGAGTLAFQLLSTGDTDGNGHGDGHAHDDPAQDASHGSDGFLPLVLALRFWSFGLLAFGLSGSLLHYLGLLGPGPASLVALVTGIASGLLASWSVRRLQLAQTSSGAETSDLVGQLGRVLVPLSKGSRGKVRVELKGQTLDFIASTDDDLLEAGSSVLVEELRGSALHVSRAGREFLPPGTG